MCAQARKITRVTAPRGCRYLRGARAFWDTHAVVVALCETSIGLNSASTERVPERAARQAGDGDQKAPAPGRKYALGQTGGTVTAKREEPSPRRPKEEWELGFDPQVSDRLSGWQELVPSTLRRLLGLESAESAEHVEPCICEPEEDPRADVNWTYALQSELWIDYVAGTGGSFNSCYSVALLLAQPDLQFPTVKGPLRQGDLLLLGGELVTRTASGLPYDNQLIGPYRASVPFSRGDKKVFALPGRADYDEGTASFRAVFCSGRWIGGRETVQRQPYFAAALPHRWWVWGLAIPPNGYLEEAQVEYFRRCSDSLREGDSVILCSGFAPWEQEYRTAEYVRSTLVEPAGATIQCELIASEHFYAHYQEPSGRRIILSAGGGASLHGTHGLPEALDVPRLNGGEARYQRYQLQAAYPSKKVSRRLLFATALGLPLKQRQFLVAIGSLYLFLAVQFSLAMVAGGQSFLESLRQRAWSAPVIAGGTGFIIELLVLAMVAFVRSSARWRPGQVFAKLILGALLSALHLGALLGLGYFVAVLPAQGIWQVLAFVAVFFLGGGLAGGWILGSFLAVHHLFSPAHKDQAYVGGAGHAFNSFVRVHIGRNRTLRKPPDLWRVRRRLGLQPGLTERVGTPAPSTLLATALAPRGVALSIATGFRLSSPVARHRTASRGPKAVVSRSCGRPRASPRPARRTARRWRRRPCGARGQPGCAPASPPTGRAQARPSEPSHIAGRPRNPRTSSRGA